MTPERAAGVGLLALLLALAGPARAADEGGEGEGEDGSGEDEDLSRYRTPFGTLVDRSIGRTSKPVAYDWRRTRVQAAATGDHLYELNNFDSLRAGAMARVPNGGVLWEFGLSYVWVDDTTASQLLALTPYRQPGKPKRLELDVSLGLPLAEGVVTARPRWFPTTELVLNAYAGLRYAIYPGAMRELRLRDAVGAVFSPTLTEGELAALEDRRLDAMQVDPVRYGLMLGLGNDLYFKQGLFLSPRVMVSVPLLAVAGVETLRWWGDASLAVGVAF